MFTSANGLTYWLMTSVISRPVSRSTNVSGRVVPSTATSPVVRET